MVFTPRSANHKIRPWDRLRWSRLGWLVYRFSLYLKHYGIQSAAGKTLRFLRTAMHRSRAGEDAVSTFINTTADEFMPFDGTVSVIIPTYNAGPEFETLCRQLKSQEYIKTVELIVVDSGSRDNTVALAKAAGATVISISQTEFSHSHARNLGAEHAKGEYLLFMTQDAIPSNSQWIIGLLQPTVQTGAVAASCKETPRADCDLLGRVSGWYHSESMGLHSASRLMRYPKQQDYESLRKNGQLNNVSCLIKRDVFMQYKFRGEFAEDLDLGLRLTKDGHTALLLASVQVIHSHTRPAIYYLKRSIVDTTTIKNLFPDFPCADIPAQECANRIITSACAARLFIQCLESRLHETENQNDFFIRCSKDWTCILRFLPKLAAEDILPCLTADSEFSNDGMMDFIRELLPVYLSNYTCDTAGAEDQMYYFCSGLRYYFEHSGDRFNENTKKEICALTEKHLGVLSGTLMAEYDISHPDDEGFMKDLVQKYRSGV